METCESLKSSLFNFLDSSKTKYHAVENIKCELLKNGFSELYENEAWNLSDGGKYFVIRGGTSIIAFKNNGGGFMICASHSDYPTLCVKCESAGGPYVRLETEKYGGMINYTWLDRSLGVGGRAVISDGEKIISRTFDIKGLNVVIPSVAIHLKRDVNDSLKLNPATDLLPLFSNNSEAKLDSVIAASLGVKKEELISYDLNLFLNEKASSFGYNNEFFLSPRIDDLSCAFASCKGFIESEGDSFAVLAVFDNEEVGSETKSGAASTFLEDTLRRISKSDEDYIRRVCEGFMVSADNAHALHPNHKELSDSSFAPTLGGGVVIKHNSNQKYTTDAVSEAIFRKMLEGAGVKLQSYYNRADMPGGSTLGAIATTKVSIRSIDIGIPQLAMHSANECAAIEDALSMKEALRIFFSKRISVERGDVKII